MNRKVRADSIAQFDKILLLHNDVHRSAMSRQRFEPDGSVVEEGRWSSGGEGGSFIAFDAAGRYFVVSNSHAGWSVFENGIEPRLIATLGNTGSGPHPRQVQSHPHCGIFSPDNQWIYAADMGSDEVLSFSFDADTGAVGEKVRAYRAAPGSGPRHVVARHVHVYLLNELGNTLVVLKPAGDGTMTEVQTLSTLPDGFDEFSHTAHLEISRDGRRVYFTNSLYGAIDPQFYPDGIDGWMVKLDAKPNGGIAFGLDYRYGRVYRHDPRAGGAELVIGRPDESRQWSRIAVDRQGLIYLYDGQQAQLDVFDDDEFVIRRRIARARGGRG